MRRMGALLLALLLFVCCATAEEHPRSWVQDINSDYVPRNDELFREYGSFTPLNCCSFDGKYMALQSVEKRENDAVKMIYVYIFDTESSEAVDVLRTERAFDFWGICWDRDSYDIYVQSADVGVYAFRYGDGVWNRDPEGQIPEYIVSRWDFDDMARLCESVIGKTLNELDGKYPDRVEAVQIGILKCEYGYIVYEIGEGSSVVTAAAGFSFTNILLGNAGMNLLSAERFEGSAPASTEELLSAFGPGYYIFNPFPTGMVWVTDDGRIVLYTVWSTENAGTLWPEVMRFDDLWEKKANIKTFDYERYERYIQRADIDDIVLGAISDYDDAIIKAKRLWQERYVDRTEEHKPYTAFYHPELDVWMVKGYEPEMPPNWVLLGGNCYCFIEGKTGKVLAYWIDK